jgi:serine/threonine-protein kinase
MELRPGAVIAGRYRVQRKIGSGGMGEVWAGEHVAIGVRVALKTLLPAASVDQQIVARFRREAQLLGRLRSDRAARVVDFVEDPRFGLVLVMDYIEGESLGSVLMTRRLSVEEAIDVGIDLATALCDLHRAKIVHRDLKPDNVILEPTSRGRRRAVLVDFGVSRIDSTQLDDSLTGITHADMAVGTLPYMAPEQLLSSRTVTASADIYALGAILYRSLTGQMVFGDGDDAASAKQKITGEAPPLSLPRFDRVAKALREIVAKALKRNPEERFESAEALLRELTALGEVARAMELDLEAATEQAMPLSSLVEADTGEKTKMMSRPQLDEEMFLDEATLQSPGALPMADDEPATSLRPPVFSARAAEIAAPDTLADPPQAPASIEAPSTSPPSTMSSPDGLRMTRPTVHSPIAAPAPEPAIEPGPRTVTLRAAVLGAIAALIVGTAFGVGAARALEKKPAPAVGAQHG